MYRNTAAQELDQLAETGARRIEELVAKKLEG